MNINCFMFGMRNFRREEIENKRILEVGSLNVNGSLRPLIEHYNPKEYIGVDIAKGQGVDIVCDVTGLSEKFLPESFDVVISTELLEHVRDWRMAITNIKGVCKQEGVILITTRSRGFVYHGYPYDFWRYQSEDMRFIFQDCQIEALEEDSQKGVFIKCRKPGSFVEKELSGYRLYSIVADRRIEELKDADLRSPAFKSFVFKQRMKEFLHKKIDVLLK